MPVFDRYKIERYKEILINQPAGLVSDGGFSTYSIDDPSINPNGTGDFLGVIKTIVLLAEVYRETIDTRNLSFNDFNNLTQQQFDNYIAQGLILKNRTTNGQPERLGWVEIGRSYPSFYYQSCDGGKRPISEHYFDIQEFAFDNKLVVGEGPEIEPTDALIPIGNFDQNIENNLGVLRPRFQPLNLTDYVRFAMNGAIVNNEGETVRINDLALTEQTRPNQISLLMANRGDHFDNAFATEVSPGKWGEVRRTIFESLKPGIHVIYPQLGLSNQQTPYNLDFSIITGDCLKISSVNGGGTTVSVGDVIETEISTNDLLKKLIQSFSESYPNFKYNSSLVEEPTSVIHIFDENFTEMDSFKQVLTYRINQNILSSNLHKLLERLDTEVKGISPNPDISSGGDGKQTI